MAFAKDCLVPPSRAIHAAALVVIAALWQPAKSLAVGEAAGDAAHGEVVYRQCMVCHSLDRNGIGPRHRGVFGRKAGSVADYSYSPALKGSNIVWDETTLDQWLSNPQGLVPGNKMMFSLGTAQDRADVIAFLKQRAAGDGAGATPEKK
jgi:cytochrome c